MPTKLGLLELGRGIASLAVVLCHIHWYLVETPDYFHFVWPWGSWGVSFFFILSGFIIYHVNHDDLDSGRVWVFAKRRFIRIFPTYWLIFGGALFIRQYLGNPDYAVRITPQFLSTNVFLLPSPSLFIAPAWSLRHELLFYAIFTVGILNLRAGTFVAAIWLATIFTALLMFGSNDDRTFWNTIASPMNLYFFIGIFLAKFVERFQLENFLQNGPFCSSWLGQVSYPLYLCHLPSFLIVHGILKRIAPQTHWLVVALAGCTASILIASAIASYFEKPFLAWANRKSITPPAPAVSDH